MLFSSTSNQTKQENSNECQCSASIRNDVEAAISLRIATKAAGNFRVILNKINITLQCILSFTSLLANCSYTHVIIKKT